MCVYNLDNIYKNDALNLIDTYEIIIKRTISSHSTNNS